MISNELQLHNQYYNFSLDEILYKVKKKQKHNGRNPQLKLNLPLENTKTITNEYGETITRIDGEIPVDLEIKNNDRFLFISFDQSILTHGFHKYPAKFFPELPRWIIKRFSKEGDLIIDPFSGSGTANVEALLNRRNSVGVDIESFARFISKVKTTPVDINELNETEVILITDILNYHPNNITVDDIPVFPYIDNWFNKEIINELAYIKKSIKSLDCSDEIKNFYYCCFSSIIRSVSNADDNCTRTVIRKKLNKQVFPSDALRKFVETVYLWVPRLTDFSLIFPDGIETVFPENMDAKHLDYLDSTFDLALTSPPYANAVDYPRTHQLETYWLGLANGSLTPQKKLHVGTESVNLQEYRDFHSIGIDFIDDKLSKIYEVDKRRSYIAYKYLLDMKQNIEEVYRVLKPGARYVVVVGNNKICGQLFENWKYIIELALKSNFSLENYFGSEIIRHFIKVPREERINTDWVIVLRKS